MDPIFDRLRIRYLVEVQLKAVGQQHIGLVVTRLVLG